MFSESVFSLHFLCLNIHWKFVLVFWSIKNVHIDEPVSHVSLVWINSTSPAFSSTHLECGKFIFYPPIKVENNLLPTFKSVEHRFSIGMSCMSCWLSYGSCFHRIVVAHSNVKSSQVFQTTCFCKSGRAPVYVKSSCQSWYKYPR